MDLAIPEAGVLKARSEWIRVYEKTYGELVALFGKKHADTFFKKAQKGKKQAAAASDIKIGDPVSATPRQLKRCAGLTPRGEPPRLRCASRKV